MIDQAGPARKPAQPIQLAIGGMIAMAVAMGIGRFVYTPILPAMMAELGLSASDAGLIASANYLGYLVGAILASGGWAETRERTLMLASLAASAVLAAAMGVTADLLLFLMIRFLAGIASAFLMVFLGTIIFSRLAAAGRNDLQAVHFGGVGAGIAISALVTGAVHLAGESWQASWFWAGLVSLAGFAATWYLVDRGPATAGAAPKEPPLPKSPELRRVILAYGIFGFGYIITATFLVAIARQGAFGPLYESSVWLVTGVAAGFSLFLWNKLVKRIGLAKTFVLSCVVEAIGVASSVLIPGFLGPLIAGLLLGGTFVGITAIGLQLGRGLASGAPRRVLAFMTASFGIGQIIGPFVAGFLADLSGNFLLASLAATAALALAAIIIPGESRKN